MASIYIGNDSFCPFTVLLRKDSSNSSVTGIGVEREYPGVVGKNENGQRRVDGGGFQMRSGNWVSMHLKLAVFSVKWCSGLATVTKSWTKQR